MSDKILQEDGFGLLLEDGSGYLVKEDAAPLDIDFTTGTLDPRITFGRSSTATYYNSSGLIASAASGAPRFDYAPVALAARGLLLEEQRTNLALYSTTFSPNWPTYNTGPGVTFLGYPTGPDGVASSAVAWRIDRVGTADYCEIYHLLAGATAALHTASMWLKANAAGDVGKQITLTLNNGVTLFNPTTVTLTNAWVRYACTGTLLGNSNDGIAFGHVSGGATQLGQVEFQAYGPQVELGAMASSYIPTTTAAVTRAADTASMTGANFSSWFNNTEGTFVVSFDFPALTPGYHFLNAFQVGLPTQNRMVLYGDTIAFYDYISEFGSGATKSASILGALTGPSKLALAFKANDAASAANGTAGATDTSVTIPPVDSLNLGRSEIGALFAPGWYKRLTFYNTRKSNSELAALTTPDPTGTGALTAQAGVVASTTGFSRSIAPSVALAAQAAAAASTTGLSRSIAASVALAPQRSVVSGLGGAGTTLVGTGVVTTRPALVAGAGLTASAGVGTLQVSVATIDAHGVSAWIATAANLNVAWADIDGLGEIPYNVVVSGPYAQVGDLWEGAAVWGKIAGKWRRLRLWTKAADAWGIAAWDKATQEVDVWSLPVYGVLDARGAHIAGSGFIRDQIWGAGDLRAGPALVTDSSSLSGLSVITHAAWEPTPAWVKVNGKWRRATMWTNVSAEWKRVA